MELVFEILFEVYLELMMLIVPEEKAASKKYRYLSIAIAGAVLVGVLALFVWGYVLIADHDNMLGVIPIVIASVISIIQITAGGILYTKNFKDE